MMVAKGATEVELGHDTLGTPPPSYFSLDLLFTASQTIQTQGLPKRKCPTCCLFEEVCLRNPDSWEHLRAEAGGINKYQEVLGAKTDKLYFCTLRRL